MKQYEYHIISSDRPEANQDQLNRFGEEGWILVQILNVPEKGWHYWFVREKTTQ